MASVRAPGLPVNQDHGGSPCWGQQDRACSPAQPRQEWGSHRITEHPQHQASPWGQGQECSEAGLGCGAAAVPGSEPMAGQGCGEMEDGPAAAALGRGWGSPGQGMGSPEGAVSA